MGFRSSLPARRLSRAGAGRPGSDAACPWPLAVRRSRVMLPPALRGQYAEGV